MLDKTVAKFGFMIVQKKDKNGQMIQDIVKNPEAIQKEDPKDSQQQKEVEKLDNDIKKLNTKAYTQQKKITQLKHDIAYFDNSLLKDPVNIQNQIAEAKRDVMIMKGQVHDMKNSNQTQKSLVKQYITNNEHN